VRVLRGRPLTRCSADSMLRSSREVTTRSRTRELGHVGPPTVQSVRSVRRATGHAKVPLSCSSVVRALGDRKTPPPAANSSRPHSLHSLRQGTSTAVATRRVSDPAAPARHHRLGETWGVHANRLVSLRLSQRLEPPPDPGRFSAVISPSSNRRRSHRHCCTSGFHDPEAVPSSRGSRNGRTMASASSNVRPAASKESRAAAA
jgi:hypothetical protein